MSSALARVVGLLDDVTDYQDSGAFTNGQQSPADQAANDKSYRAATSAATTIDGVC